MNIAIIGTGNVGGALATRWSAAGHRIRLGVRDRDTFKGKALLGNPRTHLVTIREAVEGSEAILLATPAGVINEVVESLGDVSQKVIIDATNTIGPPRGPYQTAYHCLAAKTAADIVKCFNTTGSENMLDPIYHGQPIDMFMAGESERAKEVAARLSADAGFGTCIDFGGSDKVVLLEQLALCWINLAIMQRMGRGIAFTLLRR